MKPRLLIAFALAAGVASTAPIPHALRLVVILPFLLLGPGLGFVWLCGLRDPFAGLVVSVALSIGLGVTVSQALVLAGSWSAPAAIWVLAGLTAVGVGLSPLSAGDATPANQGRRRGFP